MKKYLFNILIAITMVTFFSCEKNKEEANINSFEVSVKNDTVPAIVEVEYVTNVQNTCVNYTLTYTGADSVKQLIVVDNSTFSLEDIEFSEISNEIENTNTCASGNLMETTTKMNLLYLNAGEYSITMKMNNDSYQESFTLYEPKE